MKGAVATLNKKITVPIARWLSKFSFITPNMITIASFVVSGIIGTYAILTGHLRTASILVLAGAYLDSIDGDLARITNKATRKGAVLDAVLDRYVDILLLSGMILNSYQESKAVVIWGLLAILGSVLVPYVRAKTEAVGLTSTSTFGSRDIRNMVLFIGLFTSQIYWTLVIMAVLSNLSALHRLIFVFIGQSRG